MRVSGIKGGAPRLPFASGHVIYLLLALHPFGGEGGTAVARVVQTSIVGRVLRGTSLHGVTVRSIVSHRRLLCVARRTFHVLDCELSRGATTRETFTVVHARIAHCDDRQNRLVVWRSREQRWRLLVVRRRAIGARVLLRAAGESIRSVAWTARDHLARSHILKDGSPCSRC